MDREYWNKFYSSTSITETRSDFAQFCKDNYVVDFGKLIDIGCGNGRDTLFFSKNNIPCIGIDQSSEVIEINNKKKDELMLETHFFEGNFSTFNYDEVSKKEYSIYSRFTLHAINYDDEEKLFNNLKNQSLLKYLLIEVRSINDSLYGKGNKVGIHEYVTSHYRRFIDPLVLKENLSKNFKIIHFSESRGYAKIGDNDPCLIRVIAKKI